MIEFLLEYVRVPYTYESYAMDAEDLLASRW